jgi:hypothetical protein
MNHHRDLMFWPAASEDISFPRDSNQWTQQRTTNNNNTRVMQHAIKKNKISCRQQTQPSRPPILHLSLLTVSTLPLLIVDVVSGRYHCVSWKVKENRQETNRLCVCVCVCVLQETSWDL